MGFSLLYDINWFDHDFDQNLQYIRIQLSIDDNTSHILSIIPLWLVIHTSRLLFSSIFS